MDSDAAQRRDVLIKGVGTKDEFLEAGTKERLMPVRPTIDNKKVADEPRCKKGLSRRGREEDAVTTYVIT